MVVNHGGVIWLCTHVYGCVPGGCVVALTFVVRDGRVPFQRRLIDHGHYGHGHVSPHYVSVGHAEEQHERNDVTGADPC